MKAIVQDGYGTAPEEVLRLAETTRPTIGDDVNATVLDIRDARRMPSRNGRDSNPRALRPAAFKAAAFVRSATVPSHRLMKSLPADSVPFTPTPFRSWGCSRRLPPLRRGAREAEWGALLRR